MAVLQMPRRPLWGRFRTVEAVSTGPWGYLFRVTEALTGEPRALHVLPDGGADAAFDELSQRVRQRDPALPRIFELGRTRAPIAFGADELAADQPFVLGEWSDGEPPLAALLDGRGLPPAGSAAGWRRGSIERLQPEASAPEPSAPELVVDERSAPVIHEIDPEPTTRTQLLAELSDAPDAPGAPDLQLKPALAALEAAYIAEAMRRAGGNQTVAARLLGLSRFGLQKKLKRAR